MVLIASEWPFEFSHFTGQLDFTYEFLVQQRQPAGTTLGPVTSFNMKSLMREIEEPIKQEAFGDVWGQEFISNFPQQSSQKSKIANYVEARSKFLHPTLGVTDSWWASEYLEDFDSKVSANSAAKDLHDVMDRDAKFSKSEFKTFLKNYQENKKSEIETDWPKEFNETRGSMSSGATATGAAESGSTWTNEFSEFTDLDFEKFLGQILKNLFML